MLGRTDSRARLLFLLVGFVVASVALVGRLGYWQIARGAELATQARLQTSIRTATPSRRGAIYDRTGVVVLATTVDRDRVVAAPDELTVQERPTVEAKLRQLLALEGDTEAAASLAERLAEDRPYVILARDIEPQTAKAVRAAMERGELPDVWLEPEPVRVYPQEGGGPDSTLAAHILGFVNREGVGQYGVEQQYQGLLAGEPRVVLAQRDVNSRPIAESAEIAEPGLPGSDLMLTLDAGLQLALEQELFAAWVADRATSVSAVVLDPYTGEVFAEASYPSYDANDYKRIAAEAPSRFLDPVISHVYEPGSVFKMMTVVAALESGVVTPTTRIKDVGTLRLDGGRTKIDNANRKGRGWMTFEDAIAHSRNVVAAKVALKLGDTTEEAATVLHDTWTRLGYGAPTGIDVAGEVAGLVRDPAAREWREIDLANGSFGQGVAVTPLQLATAFSALVNGGRLVRPHVVSSVGADAVAHPAARPAIDGTLTPTYIDMMNHVVTAVPFYAEGTLIPGYFVGGKTGTAQIWDPEARAGRGDWKANLFNYSFVGFVGRETGRPDLVIAVRINEAQPTIAMVGRLEMPVMSFELFRRIAHDAITTPDLLSPVAPRPAPATPEP